MLHTAYGARGLVSAPHHLAAQAGLAVLRDGGNAIEAMIAAAAAIAVVYPHMNAIGGDGFWLIYLPGKAPVAIDACGPAGAAVTAELYRRNGLAAIPARGPLAASTVAGTVSGWAAACDIARAAGGRLPLPRLLEEAIHWAEHGVAVTAGQQQLTTENLADLATTPGFAEIFLVGGQAPAAGTPLRQPRLAATLRAIATDGPDSFYRGPLARRIAADLARIGSPLTESDLAAFRARRVEPLSVNLEHGTVFNLPPPTQGLASLMILALFERLDVREAESFAHVHGLVEATKQAFLVRDAVIADPAIMSRQASHYLRREEIDRRAARIDGQRALDWPQPADRGDTIWMGAADAAGCVVSFIQSIYWEFGSGVVLADTGINWQNRGSSFVLPPGSPRTLAPGRYPFHTLNPALAVLADGRVMAYGAMGGDGQPQTQSALYTRYVRFGQTLQTAVTAPRWLFGRTWGAESSALKLEGRFAPALGEALRAAGHEVEWTGDYDSLMGHAGAAVHRPDGVLEGAADPRSDGVVAAY